MVKCLVEPFHVRTPRRALVTILEEAPTVHDAALLSEAALAEDWNRAEEDAAWAHLQPAQSSKPDKVLLASESRLRRGKRRGKTGWQEHPQAAMFGT